MRHYAMEGLRNCRYTGNGGLASFRSFIGKFRVAMIDMTEAGGNTDDNNFTLRELFYCEFKKIPELKESQNVINRSKL